MTSRNYDVHYDRVGATDVLVEPAAPPMPTLDEILARKPGKYLTVSGEKLHAGPRTLMLLPPAGWLWYSVESLLVWPPSPDLFIESIDVGPLQMHKNIESVVGWLSPLDMEGICMSCNALGVILQVRLKLRRPIDLVTVIVTGSPVPPGTILTHDFKIPSSRGCR